MVRPLKINETQFGAKVGRHMLDYGRNPASASDRKWMREYIFDVYENATQFRDGTFSGQGAATPSGAHARGPVWFYAKGADVVITDRADNFVTLLKDGINSTSFIRATVLPRRP